MWWNKDWIKENKELFKDSIKENKEIWKNLDRLRRWGGLRYVVLYALSQSPKNGAEIMEFVERMSMGAWRPSPGSVYPLLSSMQEEKLIVKLGDGRYDLTDSGAEEIGLGRRRNTCQRHGCEGPHSTDGVLDEIESNVSYLEDLPREQLAARADRLDRLAERVQKLRESMNKTGSQE